MAADDVERRAAVALGALDQQAAAASAELCVAEIEKQDRALQKVYRLESLERSTLASLGWRLNSEALRLQLQGSVAAADRVYRALVELGNETNQQEVDDG